MNTTRKHYPDRDHTDTPPESAEPSLTPLTARFRDSALEDAFQQAQLYQVRRIMVAFALIGLFGTLLSGYGTYLSFGASSWIFTGALWVRLPLLLLALAVIPAFLTLRSGIRIYILHGLLLVWGLVAIALRMTTPYEGDASLLSLFHVSRDGMLLLLIVSMYVLILIPGWFVAHVMIMAAALAGYITLAWADPTGPEGHFKLALVSSAAFAFILGIASSARRLWRQTYLAQLRLRTANEQLEHLARTDELTGCVNRRHFFREGRLEFEKARRYDWPLAVIAIDLDHFKAVNDQYGHAGGDRVLQAFARLMRRTLRELDLPARIGGEEFLILLPGTDRRRAVILAERLRAELEQSPIETPEGMINVRASFGVADIASVAGKDFDALISAADNALYHAKRAGRNRVVEAR